MRYKTWLPMESIGGELLASITVQVTLTRYHVKPPNNCGLEGNFKI